MPMNEEVRKALEEISRKSFAFDAMVAAGRITEELALESLALADGPISTTDAQTIRDELTRLTEIAEGVDPLVVRLGEVTTRLEAANALLRTIHDAGYFRMRIDAHLSEPRT